MEFGDVLPLDAARLRKLSVNGGRLIDLIDTDHAFLMELAAVGSITFRQREHLVNLVQYHERNEKLLEFLTRRSVGDFENFIKVLSKHQQAHLACLLAAGGG